MYYYTELLNNIPFEIQDQKETDCQHERYIITSNSIFKKYKEHYYKIMIPNENYKMVRHNSHTLYSKKHNETFSKKDPLTSIPFEHYIVRRVIYKYILNDHITLYKEVDNDSFESMYFETDLENMDMILDSLITSFKEIKKQQ